MKKAKASLDQNTGLLIQKEKRTYPRSFLNSGSGRTRKLYSCSYRHMLTCFPPNVFLTLTPDPEKLKKENGEEDVIGDIGYLLVKSSIYILAIQFCA